MPFPPETKKEVWLALRADGYMGSGLPGNPYDASSPTLFDDRMNSFLVNTTIHLGAGVFQTRGDSAWNPKAGCRIIGAGIDATILKLVLKPDVSVPGQYRAIGTGSYLDGFEASDFTVDCNLDGQAINNYNVFPPLACAAIALAGRHIRLRRIRVVNFGTQNSGECFPIVPTFANPDQKEAVGVVIENCIVEKPSLNPGHQITCINIGAIERPSDGIKAFHRACVLRNCVLDCEYVDNPIAISTITFSGMTATATTKFPHGRSTDQWVVVSGALENSVPSTNYNGSFRITAVLSTTQFQYSMHGTPAYQPTGDMYAGRYSSQFVALDNSDYALNPPVVVNTSGAPNYIVTLITATPHNRVMGNNLVVSNVSVDGGDFSNAFNGLFPITEIVSPTELKYRLTNETSPGTPDLSQGSGIVGSAFQALSADGGMGAIVEGNRVYNARIGGPYHDTFSTKDIVILKNYYYSVATGPYQAMSGASYDFITGLARLGVSITRGGLDNRVATFTTMLAHGLLVGEAVAIGGADQSQYNGTFNITAVPSPTTFTYLMTADPGANASGPFTSGARWQTGRQVIKNNVIELVLNVSPGGFGYPAGIFLGFGDFAPAFLFEQVMIRGNVIRNVDNATDPSGWPVGIELFSCRNAILEDNIINLNRYLLYGPNPIMQHSSGSVRYFNNQNPAGKLIQGYNVDIVQSINELTTDAELALLKSS